MYSFILFQQLNTSTTRPQISHKQFFSWVSWLLPILDWSWPLSHSLQRSTPAYCPQPLLAADWKQLWPWPEQRWLRSSHLCSIWKLRQFSKWTYLILTELGKYIKRKKKVFANLHWSPSPSARLSSLACSCSGQGSLVSARNKLEYFKRYKHACTKIQLGCKNERGVQIPLTCSWGHDNTRPPHCQLFGSRKAKKNVQVYKYHTNIVFGTHNKELIIMIKCQVTHNERNAQALLGRA